MAQKDLKLLWGSNSKMNGSSKPAITDGKAYFAIVDGTTKYPDTAAPANEAFIYFDKDNTRYNVIAKRAIFDALGNKINSTYATDIESSGNTMSLFSADGGEAIDTATIVNSLSLSTGTQNDSKYSMKVTVNGQASSEYSLAAASDTAYGIVTTGDQSFAGTKTFTGAIHVTDTTFSIAPTMGAVVIDGGLGVGDNICAAGNLFIDSYATIGQSLIVGTTLTTGGAATIGGDLTVVGKDIFFGNTTGKIITLNADSAGSVMTLSNSNNILTFVLNNKGTDATVLSLSRHEELSWKLKHANLGNFYITNNQYPDDDGETIVGEDFSVLKLEKITGNATLKGRLEVDSLTIKNTTAIAHLMFSRVGYNYIYAPNGGSLAFSTNGNLNANCDMVLTKGVLTPGTLSGSSIGSEANPWQSIYTNYLNSNTTLYISSKAGTAMVFKGGSDGNEIARFDTVGKFKIVNGEYPAVTNSIDSGSSTLRWNNIYSATFTGDTFTGNAASATKVYVTDTPVHSEDVNKEYKILFTDGSTSGNQDVRFYNNLIYIVEPRGHGSGLKIGSSYRGYLELSDGSNHIARINTTNLTANRTITISDHAGTMMTSGNYTAWASPNTHTHNVTISHTPAGTVSRPTFTGTSNQETSSNAGYSSVASSGHTHSYNRVSSVSSHSFSTNSYTSGSNSGSAVSFYAYSGSSTPSLTASISGKCLTVTFTSPGTVAYTAAPNSHTHSYNRVNSISDHTVSASSYTSGAPSATTDVASNGHKHTYTAAGTISTPTFTGTAYSTTVTTATQNA